MTRVEIKNEIQKLLESAPDKVLEELLVYLRQLEGDKTGKESLAAHLDKILKEDKDVLTRLAQ